MRRSDRITHKVLLVRRDLTGEKAAVDSRVQCLDTAAQHLGSLGDGGNVLDREATLPDHLGGAARGQDPGHVSAGHT